MKRWTISVIIMLLSICVLSGCKTETEYPSIYVGDQVYQISITEGITSFEHNDEYELTDGVYYGDEYYDVDGNVSLPYYYFEAMDSLSDLDDFLDSSFNIDKVHQYYNDSNDCSMISIHMPRAIPLTQIRQSNPVEYYEREGYICVDSTEGGRAYAIYTDNGLFDFENESFIQSDVYSEFESDSSDYNNPSVYADELIRTGRSYLLRMMLENKCDFFVIVTYSWHGIEYGTDLTMFSSTENIVNWANQWVPAGTLSEEIECDLAANRTPFE